MGPGCLWFRHWMEHVGDRRLTDRPSTLRDCCCCSRGLGILSFFSHFPPPFSLPSASSFPLSWCFSDFVALLLSPVWSRHLDAVILFCDLQHLPHHLFTLFFSSEPRTSLLDALHFPSPALLYPQSHQLQQWQHAEFSEVYSWTARHVLQ